MNVMREIRNLNQRELELNISGTASWHADYRDSAYIFFGGISPELSEGDCIAIFSQFGEVVDLHLPRRPGVGGALGPRMGFGFLAFEDQRSTILAIDNLNGFEMQLPGETRSRFLRVDHAGKYRRPKGAAAAAAAGENAEQKAFADVETNDAEYDRRRKAIWDYERYATQDTGKRRLLAVGEIPAFEDLSAASAAATPSHVDPNDSREDAKHADRVLAMLAEKKRQRERARMRGDDGAVGGAEGGRAGAAAGGITVGVDGQRRFGDQIVPSPAAAAASSSSSSAAAATASSSASRSHHHSSSSSHRDRDGHRDSKHRSRSRSRSRDRDRDRKKDRKRSRSRSKDRQRR